MDVMVSLVEFVMRGVKKELDSGGNILAMRIMIYMGCLAVYVRFDGRNYLQETSTVQGAVNNILSRGKGRGIQKGVPLV